MGKNASAVVRGGKEGVGGTCILDSQQVRGQGVSERSSRRKREKDRETVNKGGGEWRGKERRQRNRGKGVLTRSDEMGGEVKK